MNTRPAIVVAAIAAAGLAIALALQDDFAPTPSHGAAPPSPTPAVGSDPSAIDGTVAEQGPFAQRTSAFAGSPILVVVDAATGRPVAAAEVEWSTAADAPRHLTTDAEGCGALAPAPLESCRLTIRAAAHATLRGTLPRIEERNVVALEPGGALEVTARDAAGGPVAKVAFDVLPPGDTTFAGHNEDRSDWPELESAGGVYRMPATASTASLRSWSKADARATTDREGKATWSGLPVGDDYRFVILAPHAGQTDPPHERRRLTVGPKGVTVGPAPPPNVSGRFAIAAGETTSLSACVAATGRLRGIMPATFGPPMAVRLCSISQAGGGDVKPVIAQTLVDTQPTGPDGRFVFENVKADDYSVRACWMEGAHDAHFVSITVRVPPGADVDVGQLTATVGHTATIRVGIADPDGAPRTAAQTIADPRQARALLMLDLVAESQLLADCLSEVSVVPLDEAFRVHGLPPGRIHLTARPVAGLALRDDVTRLQHGPTLEVALPTGEELRPCLRAVAECAVDIRCLGEDGRCRQPSLLLSRDRATGRVISHELRFDSANPIARLPDGSYDLLAVSREGSSLFGTTAVTVPLDPPQPAVLQLRGGARVNGRLVDAVQQPIADRVLRWTLPAWSDAAIWPWSATTDAAGRFEVHGLPPGVTLTPGTDVPPLPALDAGEHSLVLTAPTPR